MGCVSWVAWHTLAGMLAALPGVVLLAAAHVWPLPALLSLGSGSATLAKPPGGQGFFRLHQFAAEGALPPAARRLEQAFARYEPLLFNCSDDPKNAINDHGGLVSGIDVVVADAAAPLALGVSERYHLSIGTCPAEGATCRGRIEADTIYGAMQALRTLSQLVDGCGELGRAPVVISDSPRFAWRGMMIDVARHMIPLRDIEAVVDAIAECKMNVLHVHLTDAQSFPYLSDAVPALAQRGAFSAQRGCASPFNPMPGTKNGTSMSCVYSTAELKSLVGYAADRGVRTLFEVDTPAHSASWCAAMPELCVSCHAARTPTGTFSNGSFQQGCTVTTGASEPLPPECAFGYFSLLDPSKNETWSVLEAIVRELGAISADTASGDAAEAFFHIGGDELHWDCWDVPHINAWMPTVGIKPGDYRGIARYYLRRVQSIVENTGMRSVAWNEVMDQYGDAPYPPATPVPTELLSSTVIHTWYSPEWYDPPTGLPVARSVADIAATHHDVLVSFPWYLAANASTGPTFDSMWFQDVQSNLTCAIANPGSATSAQDGSRAETGIPQQQLNCTCFGRRGDVEHGCYDVSDQPELLKHVLGGEAALWGEAVDGGNFEQAVMMAAGVAAERLWSPRATLDVQDARSRMSAMRTKLRSRGFDAAPLPPVN